MTRPALGLVIGTTSRNCTSPWAARARTSSSSLRPASVWLAITRISVIDVSLPPWWRTDSGHRTMLRLGSLAGRLGDAARRGGLHLGASLEDAVHSAGYAVFVGPADDGRNRVEVEDRGRRGDLPLERERSPGVGHGAGPTAPTGDHVVDED